MNIIKAYNFKNRKKGARQIKMTLQNSFKITYNLKRIIRIMRKYNIIYHIRNPYRRIAKATSKHRSVPNKLNRKFKQNIPGKVLLAYNISDSLTIGTVTETINKLVKLKSIKLHYIKMHLFIRIKVLNIPVIYFKNYLRKII